MKKIIEGLSPAFATLRSSVARPAVQTIQPQRFISRSAANLPPHVRTVYSKLIKKIAQVDYGNDKTWKVLNRIMKSLPHDEATETGLRRQIKDLPETLHEAFDEFLSLPKKDMRGLPVDDEMRHDLSVVIPSFSAPVYKAHDQKTWESDNLATHTVYENSLTNISPSNNFDSKVPSCVTSVSFDKEGVMYINILTYPAWNSASQYFYNCKITEQADQIIIYEVLCGLKSPKQAYKEVSGYDNIQDSNAKSFCINSIGHDENFSSKKLRVIDEKLEGQLRQRLGLDKEQTIVMKQKRPEFISPLNLIPQIVHAISQSQEYIDNELLVIPLPAQHPKSNFHCYIVVDIINEMLAKHNIYARLGSIPGWDENANTKYYLSLYGEEFRQDPRKAVAEIIEVIKKESGSVYDKIAKGWRKEGDFFVKDREGSHFYYALGLICDISDELDDKGSLVKIKSLDAFLKFQSKLAGREMTVEELEREGMIKYVEAKLVGNLIHNDTAIVIEGFEGVDESFKEKFPEVWHGVELAKINGCEIIDPIVSFDTRHLVRSYFNMDDNSRELLDLLLLINVIAEGISWNQKADLVDYVKKAILPIYEHFTQRGIIEKMPQWLNPLTESSIEKHYKKTSLKFSEGGGEKILMLHLNNLSKHLFKTSNEYSLEKFYEQLEAMPDTSTVVGLVGLAHITMFDNQAGIQILDSKDNFRRGVLTLPESGRKITFAFYGGMHRDMEGYREMAKYIDKIGQGLKVPEDHGDGIVTASYQRIIDGFKKQRDQGRK